MVTIEPRQGCGDGDVTFTADRIADLPPQIRYLFHRTVDDQRAAASFLLQRLPCPSPSPSSEPTPSPTPTATQPSPVAGDCNGDGTVRINEVIEVIRSALCVVCLPGIPVPCAADLDGDGTTGIHELIAVVNNALSALP